MQNLKPDLTAGAAPMRLKDAGACLLLCGNLEDSRSRDGRQEAVR